VSTLQGIGRCLPDWDWSDVVGYEIPFCLQLVVLVNLDLLVMPTN
jgi:hypothetical protein